MFLVDDARGRVAAGKPAGGAARRVRVTSRGTYRERVGDGAAEGAEGSGVMRRGGGCTRRGRCGRCGGLALPLHASVGRGAALPRSRALARLPASTSRPLLTRYINYTTTNNRSPTCLLTLLFGIACSPQQSH